MGENVMINDAVTRPGAGRMGWTVRVTLVALTASMVAAWPAVSPSSSAEASPASTRVVDLEEWRELPRAERIAAARERLSAARSGMSELADNGRAGDAAEDEAAAESAAIAAEEVAEAEQETAEAADRAWQVTPELPVGDAIMVGVELPDGEQPDIEVRTKLQGEWSEWTATEFPGVEDGPEPDSEEFEEANNATEPVWFGEAERLQVRIEGEQAPRGAKLHAVDIDGPLEFDPAEQRAGAADAAPRIISRSAWDPNNECRPRSSPSYATNARFAVIHHTAGSNNYTQAQAASQMRGICLYHRNANGWSDIGYNLVADRFGRVYEGRAGGVERAVIGAHAANYNTGSFGVAVMGCFDHSCSSSLGSPGLPSAALRAVDEVVAWKFSIHGIDPHGRISYRNGRGSTVTLDTIVGHRDVGTTSCPGSYFAPYVRGSRPMKDRVAPLMEQIAPPWEEAQAGNFSDRNSSDLTTFDAGAHLGLRSNGGSFDEETWSNWRTRTGWQAHLVGRFHGDSRDQIASFHPRTGNWVVSRHNGSGLSHSVWTSYRTNSGWDTHLAGDFNGNGSDDVASFHSGTGNWVVSTSNGSSFVPRGVWSKFSTTRGWQTHLVGDFTGNRRDDILSYHPGTGNWMLQRSTGRGFEIERWNNFRTKTGWRDHLVGDFTGNGVKDVASYHGGTRNWIVSRNRGGAVGGVLGVGGVVTEVWDRMPTANGWTQHLVGDVTGNGRDDLVSANSTAPSLWINRSTGSSFEGARLRRKHDPGAWDHHVLLDVNGNGRQDVASYHGRQNSWWVTDSGGEFSRWR